MLLSIFRLCRGILNGFLLLLTMLSFSTLIVLFAPIQYLIPHPAWQRPMRRALFALPSAWMSVSRCLIQWGISDKWAVTNEGLLARNDSYLLIANHQSWLDILVLGVLLNKKAPVIKFFMKKELLWMLPIGGLACWFLGYPFMARHTRDQVRKNPALRGQDVQTAKKACQKFKQDPTTVMSFVEGTRFSAKKHTRQASPYQHLLKPKMGAFAVVLNEMGDSLSGIIDVTIAYSKPNLSLWQFLCGDFEKISAHYLLRPITPDLIGNYESDRAYRKILQSWLNRAWSEKDQRLAEIVYEGD